MRFYRISAQAREVLAHLDDELFATPMLLGAWSGSHHSSTLLRLHAKGWVERRNRGGGWMRPAWEYRITPAGRDVLAATRGWLT